VSVLLLRDEDVAAALTPTLAMAAIEEALLLEAEGCTEVPPRLNATVPGGWLRLMPAAVKAGGATAIGFKAMNLNQAEGVRYVVFLYDAASGRLEAILDAARLTRVRTAAVTAIACRSLRPEPPDQLGLLGSGNEARTHAEAFKEIFPTLDRIVLHSPTPERRAAFADEIGGRLGIEVRVVDDPREAARLPVVVLATKSPTPVVEAAWFQPGSVVLSIGSTRPVLRELDAATFARADACLADAPEQLLAESGDVRDAVAAGHLQPERLVRLSELRAGRRTIGWPPRDLLVFKSVGSALQDLAVARAIHAACRAAGRGIDLGGFPVAHTSG
jgi:alanine dehydrogenase